MTAILSFLAMLTPYIPILLDVAGWAIKTFGASAENLAQYQAMIEANKDAGLITVETYQRLSDFHQQMIADAQAKLAAQKKS